MRRPPPGSYPSLQLIDAQLFVPLFSLSCEMIVSAAAAAAASPPSTLLRPFGVPPLPSSLRILELKRNRVLKNGNQGGKRVRGACRAELAQDAPFAAAIGACVLSSLVFPAPPGGPDDDNTGGGGALDSTDARFAVMGIISFIPYFNWMSWVFAWLDSGRRRYVVYAIVYLAPYFRTNLSLSPEESWLPIASILICIIHVQLEASIRNGDLSSIQFFDEARKLFTPMSHQKESQFENYQGIPKKGRSKEHGELPSEQESRDKLRDWRIPRKPVDDLHNLNAKPDVDAKEKDSD